MQSPFFSVVIPTLNEEKALPNLLKDLHQQTFQHFEIHIVDGSSEDKTQQLARTHTTKNVPQTLHLSKKRNVGTQRNVGAKHSMGKYILFLDADSRIPRYFLEGIHYQLVKKPQDIWTTWAKPDSDDPRDIIAIHAMNVFYEAGKSAGLPMAVGACLGCKKSVFAAIHGFDAEIRLGEDYDFVYRAVRHGYRFHIFRDPQFIYSYRRIRHQGHLASLPRVLYSFQILKALLRNQKIIDPTIYPMLGGSFFTKKKTPTKISYMLTKRAKTFQKLLEKNKILFERALNDLFG